MKEKVAIFSGSNDYYVPYLAVCIHSVNNHLSDDYEYEFIVVELDISKPLKDRILSMNLRPNLHVRFEKIEDEDMVSCFENLECGKWSPETYISILAPYIFGQYDKIIYMDCDVVNLCDLSALYCVDMGNDLVAASRLLGRDARENNGFLTKQVCVWEKDDTISQFSDYFNKGIILMNLKELRKTYSLDFLCNLIKNNRFPLLDQDCTNYLCKGRTRYVESGWNWYPYTAKEFQNMMRLCSSRYKSYFEEGYQNPRNIHYTIPVKPWLEPEGEYAEAASLFWENAVDTPFYDEIVERMQSYQKKKNIIANCENTTLVDMISERENFSLYLYGLGEKGKACVASRKYKIHAIIDADVKKQGTYMDIPVIGIQELEHINKDEAIIIVSNVKYEEIVVSLHSKGFKNIFILNSSHVGYDNYEKVMAARSILEDEKSKQIYSEIIQKRMKLTYDKSVKCIDIYEGNMFLNNDFIVQDYYADVDIQSVNETLANGQHVIGNQKYNYYVFDGTDLQSKIQEVTKKLKKSALFFVNISPVGDDLWEIPIFLHDLFPKHQVYIRHHDSNLFGTVVYAVPSLER